MNSYSQFGEDKRVDTIFRAHGCDPQQEMRNLLDIGAWGVKDLSNSRAFIEIGWHATLCEFSPKPIRELIIEYAQNDRVRIVQCAVTPVHQHCLEFRVSDDALSATPESATAGKWATAGGYYGRLFVPTVPIRDIVDQFFGDREIDYLSIDTEGTSVDLLLEFLALGRRPLAIVCEHDSRDQHIWEAAKAAGYGVYDRNETNVILERIQG